MTRRETSVTTQNPDGYGRIGGPSCGPEQERPDTDEMDAWRKEAAMWITTQVHIKYRQSIYAQYGSFDAKLFEEQVREVIAEATHDAYKTLDGHWL